MARLFDITTTSDNLSPAPDGTVRMVFTVTNISPNALRGTLLPKALDVPKALESAKAKWLAVAGDVVRDFPPGLAHQVEVTARLPPGTEAGKYRVRLDAAAVEAPEEDFTEGPPISIAIAVPKPPVERSGVKWWVWLIIGLVVFALIGGVVAWLLLRKKTEPAPELAVIPADVVGKPFDEAKQALEKLGLVVNRATQDVFDTCPDKVITTAPPPGASAAASAPVTVTVGNLPYGPDTCRQGFVWREAFKGDTVCVTPESRAQAQQDNAANLQRIEWVPATSKDFDEIQREHPEARAVPKGDFTALLARVPARVMIDAVTRVAQVSRCKAPYTERRAYAQDRVCVTTQTQLATDAENKQAASHRACATK